MSNTVYPFEKWAAMLVSILRSEGPSSPQLLREKARERGLTAEEEQKARMYLFREGLIRLSDDPSRPRIFLTTKGEAQDGIAQPLPSVVEPTSEQAEPEEAAPLPPPVPLPRPEVKVRASAPPFPLPPPSDLALPAPIKQALPLMTTPPPPTPIVPASAQPAQGQVDDEARLKDAFDLIAAKAPGWVGYIGALAKIKIDYLAKAAATDEKILDALKRAARGEPAPRSQEAPSDHITPNQAKVIDALSQGPASNAEIASKTGMKDNVVSAVMTGIVRKGLVIKKGRMFALVEEKQ